MSLPILIPIRDWYCPNCGMTDRTQEALPHSRFHQCSALHGLTAPLFLQGVKAKVEAKMREDYVGKDMVQTGDDGKPYMSVVTTRDDGQDTAVFAPTAVVSAGN